MEKKKTSPIVYVLLIAAIIALGVFIFHRLDQNAKDRAEIDKILGK